MDHVQLSEIRVRRQRRRTAPAISYEAEADLATRLLIAALVLVLLGVVAASAIVRVGGFGSAEADGSPACVRLANDETGRCATRTEVADRLLARHLGD